MKISEIDWVDNKESFSVAERDATRQLLLDLLDTMNAPDVHVLLILSHDSGKTAIESTHNSDMELGALLHMISSSMVQDLFGNILNRAHAIRESKEATKN